MSTHTFPGTETTSATDVARAAGRRTAGLVLGAVVLSALFVLSYGYALHAPRPHGLRLDVAGTSASPIATALDHAQPGAFRVHEVADAGAARHDLENTTAYGALVVPVTGPLTIMTAGAAGLPAQQAATAALRAVATTDHRAVVTTDVVPVSAADRVGQSSFVYEIGLLIPGVIGSVGFYLVGRRARLWVRVGAATAYAVFAAALGVLVLDGSFGALTGSPGTLLLTGMLAAAAFVLSLAALHVVFGLPGTGIAAAALLVVGNAVNGSTVPIPFLPDGYRQLALWLPNAAAVRAFRNDVYFHDHALGRPLLTLTTWVVAALTVIAVADRVHLRRRRRNPSLHATIHSTPLLTRRRHGRHELPVHRRAGERPARQPRRQALLRWPV